MQRHGFFEENEMWYNLLSDGQCDQRDTEIRQCARVDRKKDLRLHFGVTFSILTNKEHGEAAGRKENDRDMRHPAAVYYGERQRKANKTCY